MDKLFSLDFYSYPNNEYPEKFHIGLFNTQEEAQQVEAHYRKEVKGFKDYHCDAVITEVPVIGNADNTQKVYRFVGWNTNEDLDEIDIIESDCFVSSAQAGAELAQAEKVNPRQEWALNCNIIGQCDWCDGFTRTSLLTTKNSCYTYFRIAGDFDPAEVTQLLGLQPDESWKAGDTSERHGMQYDFSAWHFGRCDDYNPYVEEQMRKTIAPLLTKIDILNQIRERNDVAFFLEVVPTTHAGDTTPCLAPPLDVIDFCHATRTEIDIDMYVLD